MFALMMNKLSKKTDYNTSGYVAYSFPVHYGECETIEKKYMPNIVYMEFENSRFPVSSGYDKYLTNLYGKNYMKISDTPNTGTHFEDWEILFMR